MFCDHCKKNQATVHLVSVVNGVKQERHLCAECAAKEGMGTQVQPFSVNDLISGFFDYYHPREAASEKVCPRCGLRFSQFKNTGMLGCSSCYDVFRDELTPMLKSIHGSVQHNGRTIDIEQNQQKSKLEQLKSKLNEAVSNENYEQAAEIRDEIKKMEAEGGR